jgi:hypothetical protein
VNVAPEMSQAEWKSIKFNMPGDRILIGNQRMCILMDGFADAKRRILEKKKKTPTEQAASSCLTSDD